MLFFKNYYSTKILKDCWYFMIAKKVDSDAHDGHEDDRSEEHILPDR